MVQKKLGISMKSARKYFAYYKMRLQRTLAYPGSIIIFRLSNILMLVTLVSVWLAAKSDGSIGGYTLKGLITYYLLGLVINSMVFWHSTPSIRDEIIKGELGIKSLVKPVSYYWQKFFEEFAWHTTSPLFAIASVFLVLPFVGVDLHFPTTFIAVILLVVSLGLASIIFFNLSSCLGLLAFWFTEIEGIISFVWVGVFLLGGQSVPLSFFPSNIKILIDLLPFRYIYSFPVELYFEKLNFIEVVGGFVAQISWLIGLGVLYKILWRRGVRHYSAYGG